MKTMEGPWTQGNGMPGWGIVADLTPPELLASRRMRVVRRLVIVGVAAVVLLCVGGYGYAVWQNDQASSGLTAEQDRTTSLLAQQRRYSGVTVVHGSILQVQTQLAGLMAADVNVGALVRAVVIALPKDMTIDQLTVTVSAASASGGSSSGGKSTGAGELDMSDAVHIGTIALSGTGRNLTDLAAYVDSLRKMPGLFDPYPLSNQTTDTGTSYSLQVTLTDALLTHHYDLPAGAK